jgi:hypothetical protein
MFCVSQYLEEPLGRTRKRRMTTFPLKLYDPLITITLSIFR